MSRKTITDDRPFTIEPVQTPIDLCAGVRGEREILGREALPDLVDELELLLEAQLGQIEGGLGQERHRNERTDANVCVQGDAVTRRRRRAPSEALERGFGTTGRVANLWRVAVL